MACSILRTWSRDQGKVAFHFAKAASSHELFISTSCLQNPFTGCVGCLVCNIQNHFPYKSCGVAKQNNIELSVFCPEQMAAALNATESFIIILLWVSLLEQGHVSRWVVSWSHQCLDVEVTSTWFSFQPLCDLNMEALRWQRMRCFPQALSKHKTLDPDSLK